MTGQPPDPAGELLEACDGDLTCVCAHCVAEREDRVARGVLPHAPQPWETRPAARA